MIAPLLALLLQAPDAAVASSAPAPRTVVHVSLDSRGPLARGTAVRVYVELGEDGNLVVLHRRTDGRIEVLFPSNPAADPFVKAGTYEIHRDDGRAAWVVAEPDGTGMILAALSPDPLRLDEFVRAAAWNPDALVSSWTGADGEAAMSDVVQRMLGDGYFNYDVVSYTVAPPAYASLDRQDQQVAPPAPDSLAAYAQAPPPAAPLCLDCTIIGEQVIIERPFHGRHRFRGDRDGERASAPTHAIALALGPTSNPMSVPRAAPPSRFAPPRHAHPQPSVAPRPRKPVQSQPLTHVRYTRFSAPLPERPTIVVMPRTRLPETVAAAVPSAAPIRARRGLAVASGGTRMREATGMSAEQRPTGAAVASVAPTGGAHVGGAVALPREVWGRISRTTPRR